MAVYSLALVILLVALRVEATQLYSWGVNDYGQLGIVNQSIVRNPQAIPAYTNLNIKTLKASGTFHMAITTSGDVYVCGNNWYGGLGLMLSTGQTQGVPKKNADLQNCTIHVGKRHGNAVCKNLFVGWGLQAGYVVNYTSGNYGKVTQSLPVYKLGSNVVNVTTGSRFSILGLNNGSMFVVGDGTGGVLGIDDTSVHNSYVKFDAFANIPGGLLKIFPSTAEHICAISTTYSLYCWGYNEGGQLGIGNTDNQTVPTLVEFFEKDYYVIQVATGTYHTIALTAGGRVFTWGQASNGVLGNGAVDNETISSPIEVTPLADKDIVEVVAGENFNYARTSSNQWYSWGAGYGGVLGTLSDADVNQPALVPFQYTITRIVTASTSRSVYGWLDPTVATNRSGPPLVYACETQPDQIQCPPNSKCQDTDRSYTCICNSGYQGSKDAGCTDINECDASNTPSVCVASASCINLPGSYNCSCPANLPIGDGKSTGTGCSPRPTPPPTPSPTPSPTPKPTPTPTPTPTQSPTTTDGSPSNSTTSTTGQAPDTTSTSISSSSSTSTSTSTNSPSTSTGASTTGNNNSSSTTDNSNSTTNPVSTGGGSGTNTSTTAASTTSKATQYQTLSGSKDDINPPSTSSTSTSGGQAIIIQNPKSKTEQHDKNVMIGVIIAFSVLIAIVVIVGIIVVVRARRPRRA